MRDLTPRGQTIIGNLCSSSWTAPPLHFRSKGPRTRPHDIKLETGPHLVSVWPAWTRTGTRRVEGSGARVRAEAGAPRTATLPDLWTLRNREELLGTAGWKTWQEKWGTFREHVNNSIFCIKSTTRYPGGICSHHLQFRRQTLPRQRRVFLKNV
jgi:hypothetical protein